MNKNILYFSDTSKPVGWDDPYLGVPQPAETHGSPENLLIKPAGWDQNGFKICGSWSASKNLITCRFGYRSSAGWFLLCSNYHSLMPTAARPMTSQPMTGDATRMRTTTTMTTARTVKMTTMGIGLMSVMEVFSAVHPHPLFFSSFSYL
jgi:hypothetical protein